MNRIAKQLIAMAVQVTNPELNVLMMNQGDDNLLVILAENVPQDSEQELTYTVASYLIDNLQLEPSVLFLNIPTLSREQGLFTKKC